MNVNGIRVLVLSGQPHIDPVLISNDWRSKSHLEGATDKASGLLNWLIGELSFSCARDSAFLRYGEIHRAVNGHISPNQTSIDSVLTSSM